MAGALAGLHRHNVIHKDIKPENFLPDERGAGLPHGPVLAGRHLLPDAHRDLPFHAADPVEWAHCHIARAPTPPHERVPQVPPVVSSIVLKLLAKTAEERYQGARGLQRDLERCLEQLRATGGLESFPLGQHDVPERFRIPRRLSAPA